MFLNYLLPFGKFTLSSPLTSQQIMGRLKAITGSDPGLMGPDDISGVKWVFIGEISAQTFRLMTPQEDFSLSNLSRSRNICRPVLIGRLSDAATGSLITVRLRMQIMTCVIYTAIPLFAIVVGIWETNTSARWMFLGLLFILLVGIHGFFWTMARRARLLLTSLSS